VCVAGIEGEPLNLYEHVGEAIGFAAWLMFFARTLQYSGSLGYFHLLVKIFEEIEDMAPEIQDEETELADVAALKNQRALRTASGCNLTVVKFPHTSLQTVKNCEVLKKNRGNQELHVFLRRKGSQVSLETKSVRRGGRSFPSELLC
ncbi:hypothetical protein C5167_034946, partial [Papaver somniferum]